MNYALQATCLHDSEWLSWNDCAEHLDTECFVATCEGCGTKSFDCGEDFA